MDIDGKTRSLSEFAGKVTLVVNVASACGYTDENYKGECGGVIASVHGACSRARTRRAAAVPSTRLVQHHSSVKFKAVPCTHACA